MADGPVLVSPGAGQAGAGRAARGAAAGRVHGVAGLALTWRPGRPLGLQSSNPALDRVKIFVKMYVRQVSLGGRTERLWLASCLYQFCFCVGQVVVNGYSVHARSSNKYVGKRHGCLQPCTHVHGRLAV